jgi:hypothetical protein
VQTHKTRITHHTSHITHHTSHACQPPIESEVRLVGRQADCRHRGIIKSNGITDKRRRHDQLVVVTKVRYAEVPTQKAS